MKLAKDACKRENRRLSRQKNNLNNKKQALKAYHYILNHPSNPSAIRESEEEEEDDDDEEEEEEEDEDEEEEEETESNGEENEE